MEVSFFHKGPESILKTGLIRNRWRGEMLFLVGEQHEIGNRSVGNRRASRGDF